MKLFTVLDELVDVFDDVLGEGRSQQAAMAQRAMAEFGSALTPGYNFVAKQQLRGFVDELIFAGEETIGNFAIVQNGLGFLRIESGLNFEGSYWVRTLADVRRRRRI